MLLEKQFYQKYFISLPFLYLYNFNIMLYL